MYVYVSTIPTYETSTIKAFHKHLAKGTTATVHQYFRRHRTGMKGEEVIDITMSLEQWGEDWMELLLKQVL